MFKAIVNLFRKKQPQKKWTVDDIPKYVRHNRYSIQQWMGDVLYKHHGDSPDYEEFLYSDIFGSF